MRPIRARANSWPRLSRRPPRRAAQRGQALIEFTFIFAFVMMPLLVGVTDIAFMLDAHLNVVYAARQGARTGAVLGTGTGSVYPDCAIVGAVHATLLNQSDVTVTQITIYKADANGQDTTGKHQVYQGADYCKTSSGTPTWNSGGPAGGGSWPPSVRSVTAFTEDSIGVAITYQYQFRFNLWQSGTLTLTDSSVYPMNVDALQTPVPTPTP
jgi:TadE-like protein